MEAKNKELFKNREEMKSAITLGQTVCNQLKNIYFDDKPWADCYKEVAQKFTALKQIMRKFYTDKEEMEMLRELATYSKEDIQDAFKCST